MRFFLGVLSAGGIATFGGATSFALQKITLTERAMSPPGKPNPNPKRSIQKNSPPQTAALHPETYGTPPTPKIANPTKTNKPAAMVLLIIFFSAKQSDATETTHRQANPHHQKVKISSKYPPSGN
jgi:hypothetical protein